MESLFQDLRFGARMLMKQPGFTLIAIITLALGIGANTAIFSVVHALMLRPLPYSEPERVFSICQTDKDPKSRDGLFTLWSYPKLDMLRQGVTTMDFAAFKGVSARLTSSEEAEQIWGERVTPNYFSVLGVAVIAGRAFTEEENQVGESKVVMISHGFWQERFGGDPTVIGKTIELDKAPRTIIGVLEPSFKGQDGTKKFWEPFKSGMRPGSGILTEPNASWFEVIGRLKRGASREQAEAGLSLMTRRIAEKYPWPKGLSNLKDGQIKLVSLRDRKLNPVIRRSFLILLAAVGFVLLIACANLANLMMTRMASRRKELAVRVAVGATRWRIVRQLLVESIVISLIGGMFGLLLALWGVDLLNKFKSAAAGSIFWANYTNAFNFFSIGMNAPVAIFNFALAAITG
ncbi:MAG: ABC transporter permease, partial [Chloracidobacterium sp.]|nr:ABC transporter permease [Chloracidobacterium sp.]